MDAVEKRRKLFNRNLERNVSIRSGNFFVFPSDRAAWGFLDESNKEKPMKPGMRFEIWKDNDLWFLRRV